MTRTKRIAPALLGALFAAIVPALAQDEGARVSRPGVYSGYSAPLFDGYELSSFYVPVRDGTRLAVDLLRPTKNGAVATDKLPVVWMHTPYNRRGREGKSVAESYPGFAAQLVKYGYNVAVVDFRGLYASYGQNYAFNAGEFFGPAFTDAYDMTEWFAKQPWSSGKIGMWGCSATGGSQVQAALTLPPSLKAIFPMSPNFDSYTFAVNGGVSPPGPVVGTGHPAEGSNPNAARDKAAVAVDGPNGAAELAAAIAQHIDNTDAVGVVPFRDSPSAPLKGVKWWETSSPSHYLKELRKANIGVYTTATWDELMTKPAAFFLYANLPAKRTKLLVGPEVHCAWANVEKNYGFSIVTEELRFFDYWLKGVKNGVMDEPAVNYFTYNAPKGLEWSSAKTWPLTNEMRTAFYLSTGALHATRPTSPGRESAEQGAPLPDRIANSTPFPGGLVYETPPLASATQVTGHPVVDLWIATAAKDADVIARLEDVAPDGSARTYQMIGRLRASGRALAKAPYDNMGLPWHGFRAAEARPLDANAPTRLSFDMLPMSYIFPAGHKIRLRLVFTDPAHRTGQPAVAVLHGPGTESALTLPIIPK